MIDLHTHSSASDGTKSPSELLRYALSKKIRVLALTDHDTTAGLKEAEKEAAKIKEEGHDFTFIPGIELNIQWPTGEFHLLGLGLKKVTKELKELEDFLDEERKNRNFKMAEKLKAAGIDISVEEVEKTFNTSMIGRPHFAECMVKKGFIKKRQEAFDRYFAKGRPCYTDRHGADLEESCKAIIASGGIPVQAHPMSMYISWGKMEEALRKVRDAGVLGIEAWHPGVRVSEAERLEKLANALGMFVTAGSDFHGEKVREDRIIGHSAGKKIIEDRFYDEELKAALEEAEVNFMKMI